MQIVFSILVFLSIIIFSAHAAESKSQDLGQIVVSRLKQSTAPVYSISSQSLQENYFATPIEAPFPASVDLQSRSSHGGVQSDFTIRGSNFQGVRMLLNGQRINDPQTGHHNADIPFTSADLDRIDVTPGGGSAIFGPDAMGGSINFILKRPTEQKRIMELGFGEHRTGKALFSISERMKDAAARLSVESEKSSGFRWDTDFRTLTSSFNSFLDLPDGDFDFAFGYQQKEFGAYDFYTPNKGYPSKEWTETYLISTGANLDKEFLTVKPRFLWRRHFDKFMLDKTREKSSSVNYHHTDIFTPQLYLQKKIDFLGLLGLGAEYDDEYINSSNIGKHRRGMRSIFMDDENKITDAFSYSLSWRMDMVSSNETFHSGSGGLNYELNDENSFNINVARSIRLPSFTELYYSDPTTVGDPGLSAEKAINYQVGYKFKKEKFSFSNTFFYRNEDDFVDWIKYSSSDAKWKAENISSTKVFGVEQYVAWDINDYFNLDASYSYVGKDIDDKGLLYKYGQNYSRHQVKSGLNFKLPFGLQSLSITYKKKPGRAGWFLCNPVLTYQANKYTLFFVKVSNVFNDRTQDIEGIPAPGRWTEAGVRFTW